MSISPEETQGTEVELVIRNSLGEILNSVKEGRCLLVTRKFLHNGDLCHGHLHILIY